MVAPGFEAEALAVIVVATPDVRAEEAVGLVIPTDGAALIVTRTLEETPMLPKLSVTSALNV